MKLVPSAAALLLAWQTVSVVQHWYVAGEIERQHNDVTHKKLFLRVISEGRKAVRAVFDDDETLVDCDVSEEKRRRDTVEADEKADNVAALQTVQARCLRLHEANTAALGRSKRSLLVYPGTKWCGKGASARSYDDLGDSSDTDMCCRTHDFCPYTISGLTSKYNLFNYRFHTLSHCDCDDRLRTCLNRVKSDVIAPIVKSLYFSIAGNDCFVLKPEKVCVKRSWWGKCQKYMKTYTAVYRQ